MSDHPIDPPRLFDEPESDLLREALSGARADVPDPTHVEAMLARFPLPGGGGPSGPSGPPGGPSAPAITGASKSGALAKIGAAVVVAGAIGGAAVLGLRGAPAPEAPARSASVGAPEPSARPASAVSIARPADSASPSAPTSASAALPPRPASSVPASSPKVDGSAAIDEGGPSEMDLLREAQAALASSPARALSLASEHERRFPKGAFGQERDMIRIQALVALGRADEARALADDFRRRHPGSAHLARLDELFPPR
jgi:hypothetical protein